MNSPCENREEMLVALLYEDGDEAELAAARAHLAECAECRREYEELTGTREMLAAWPNVSNAPRVVYVPETAGLTARLRRWLGGLGSLGSGSVLKPAFSLVAATAVIVIALSTVRFQVGPDGILQIGFTAPAGEPAARVAEADNAAATNPDFVPVSREDLSLAMQEMAGYLTELVQNTRSQDRQLILATLQDELDGRDARLTESVMTAVNNAFAADFANFQNGLNGLTLAYQDLRDITGSELQKTNAILAALLQPGELQERK